MQETKSADISREKREYMKDEMNELATNSKNKNIRGLYRGINEYKKACQHRNYLVKDGNDYLLADFQITLYRWKN
jgi:hypothetical protein